MTPWIDTSKIRVGPISPEERRAIDAQLARLIAQHRLGTDVPQVFGAVTKPKRKGKCSPEHAQRLREYNRRRSEAIRARKLAEAANGPGKNEVRFREATRAAAVTFGVASADAGDTAHA
jgi:hypothetical protein